MIAKSPPPAAPEPSVESRKAALEARLAALMDRMSGIEAELASHQSSDWPDLATERESDEVLETLGLSAQQERGMIEAALSRITLGTYGTCVRCGADIPTERLDLLPFTPFCSACAA